MFFEGLMQVFEPLTFCLMFVGVLGGLIIGAIPGMSGSMGIILLMPLIYKLNAASALVVLAGIFCGSMYGGSISAILVSTPGTPSAAATVLDGFPLTQQGKAGKALGISVFSSFFGGLASSICLLLVAPQLARVALEFQATEYFALSIFGLTIMASSSGKNFLKGLISGWLGLFLSTVGIDGIMGIERFTFGSIDLMSGFSLLPVLIGLFAFSQVFEELENRQLVHTVVRQQLDNTIPSWQDIRCILPALLIGSFIGVFIGIIPGTGGSIACFLAYDLVKRFSKDSETFGTGRIEGIAAPESSNNATTGGAMIPLLTLAVPGDVITAVMLGALILIGIRPGPMLFIEQPHAVYTLLAGMIVIQFLILFIGMGASKITPRLLHIPKNILMPCIIVFCVLGAYTISNKLFDVELALIFGLIGYFMKKLDYPAAPMILGIILGPMAEDHLNRALLVSRNDWSVFLTRPISCVFLVLSVISIVIAFRSYIRSHPGATT